MRQLAAILFADIAGYSATMQENEPLATSQRRRFKQVINQVVPEHHGEVLQFYGDGCLCLFNSAINGVRAAISIQQKFQQNAVVPVRMGIHTGDVSIDEENIVGDGVNLASRIESMAVAGAIFISEKVYDDIRNQDGITVHEMGYFEFKNFKQPVRIFAIANEGITLPSREQLRGKMQPAKNRLAILPFVNMSADPENEYFSDGITEELLNALARVEGLKVTSRTSAFAFKGRNEDIRDIAIQLNVDRVLEGSVRKSGNRVRITAQLINAMDGYHIWSEVYDRDLHDIFAVQDEISGIIAGRLQQNFVPEKSPEPLVKTTTENVLAYTCYLKGLHFWNKLTPADVQKAITFFEQAIEIEPRFAKAWAMAATAYSLLGGRGQMLPDEAFKITHCYADKAIELDDTVAEGLVAKASAFLLYDWKWDDARHLLERAIQINPAVAEGYQLLGMYHVSVGNIEKAVGLLEQADQIDPLSMNISLSLGSLYSFAHRFDDSIRQADKMLELNPQLRGALELKGWATGLNGNWHKALEIFEEVHRLTGHPLKGLMGLGLAHGMLGNTNEAMDCIHKLERRQQEEPDSVIDADLAGVWMGLKNYDKVFYYLNQCIEKRMGPISYFLEHPTFDNIRQDTRYKALKQRMGLPDGT